MKLSKRALGLAISIHAAIVILIVVYLYQGPLYSVPAQPTASVEMAYLANPALASTPARPVMSPQQVVTPRPVAAPIKLAVTAETAPKSTASAKTVSSSASTIAMPLAPQQMQQLLLSIAESIQKNLNYPSLAETHIEQGTALLQFVLLPDGQLQDIQMVKSSGVAVLDQAAIAAVTHSSPIAVPADIKFSTALPLRLPVNFSLR